MDMMRFPALAALSLALTAAPIAAQQTSTKTTSVEGITELSKAKNSWLQEFAQQRSNDDELASQIASHREVNRTFKYDADLERRVQAVTIAQVNAAIRKYLIPASFTRVRAGDFDKAKGKVPVQ
jgi:zinc protease